MFPYHEVAVVDPGKAYALAHVHAGGGGLVNSWYAFTEAAGIDGVEKWEW
jgi:protease II